MIRRELFEFRRKWILLELPFAESHSLPRAVSRLRLSTTLRVASSLGGTASSPRDSQRPRGTSSSPGRHGSPQLQHSPLWHSAPLTDPSNRWEHPCNHSHNRIATQGATPRTKPGLEQTQI